MSQEFLSAFLMTGDHEHYDTFCIIAVQIILSYTMLSLGHKLLSIFLLLPLMGIVQKNTKK